MTRADASGPENHCRPNRIPAIFRLFMQQVNLGIIGGGTVGGGVFQAIQRNGALISSRLGVRLHIARVAVRDVRKPRTIKIPSSLLTAAGRSAFCRREGSRRCVHRCDPGEAGSVNEF